MAKSTMAQSSEGPTLFYSVSAAVGPGAPNRREDVLLVQYLLRESFKGPGFLAHPFPGPPLVVDGVASPNLFAAIVHFQRVARLRGRTIATDGRVDAPVGEQMRGSISQTQYTIIFLNSAYDQARPQDYPRVSKAGDCPAELRLPLREPSFIGRNA